LRIGAAYIPLYVMPKSEASTTEPAGSCEEVQLPITAEIMGWMSAWQSGNRAAYNAFYIAEPIRRLTSGSDQRVQGAWREAGQLVPREVKAESIRIDCEEGVVIEKFILRYSLPSNSLTIVSMKMTFARQQGRWLIRSEERETHSSAGTPIRSATRRPDGQTPGRSPQ